MDKDPLEFPESHKYLKEFNSYFCCQFACERIYRLRLFGYLFDFESLPEEKRRDMDLKLLEAKKLRLKK